MTSQVLTGVLLIALLTPKTGCQTADWMSATPTSPAHSPVSR